MNSRRRRRWWRMHHTRLTKSTTYFSSIHNTQKRMEKMIIIMNEIKYIVNHEIMLHIREAIRDESTRCSQRLVWISLLLAQLLLPIRIIEYWINGKKNLLINSFWQCDNIIISESSLWFRLAAANADTQLTAHLKRCYKIRKWTKRIARNTIKKNWKLQN